MKSVGNARVRPSPESISCRLRFRWTSIDLLSGLLLVCAMLLSQRELMAQPLEATRITDNVYFVQGRAELGSSANRNFVSNAGFVITADSVVVIDALGSPPLATALIEQIRRFSDKPISHVLVTHYHADHIYGLQVFKQAGAVILAHPAAREYLQSEAAQLRLQTSRVELAPWVDERTVLVAADRWIDSITDLHVGGVHFRLLPAGPAHTAEDLVVSVVDSGVVFSGDLAFLGRIPFVGQANSQRWIESIDRLESLAPKVLVPGHGPFTRSPKDALRFTRDYLSFLRRSMGTAARDMEPFDEAYLRTDWSGYSELPLFKLANRMNAYNTYLLMEQER